MVLFHQKTNGMGKKTGMAVIHPHAAGIDVGSRSHYVAVGQRKEDVREFGVYVEDLNELCQWLLDKKITHVAMESTGTYWQTLFSVLQESGLEVTLCNGKFTKNIKGKKTDILDCQWIQKLHTIGLLSSSFLPDSETEILRTYCRHRQNLVELSADCTRRMQKYLRLLGMRLDIAVKDITGQTGMLIIEAICAGETDGKKLASYRHPSCRKSEKEIAAALQSNRRPDYLLALQQELVLYKEYQRLIEGCEKSIEESISKSINAEQLEIGQKASKKPHKRVNKNAPKSFDLNQLSFLYYEGVDLMSIEGVSHSTVLTLMSEVGVEGMQKFETAKHFASWLRLSPNTKKTGGKVISSHVPKGSNRLKIALRNAANAIGNLKESHMGHFFRRVSYRRGRAAAISATARKLAVIIWNMIVKKMPYNPPTEYLFLDQKRQMKLVSRVKKTIEQLKLQPSDLGFTTT